MQNKINQDLKAAMLAKDAPRVTVLRAIKSAFIYAAVAPGASAASADELDDATVMAILAKEAKKRQESADSYQAAGRDGQADTELAEKAIIEAYLPARLSEADIQGLVDEAVAGLPPSEVSPKAMGRVIAAVKAKAGPAADGAIVARLAKMRLSRESGR